MSHRRLLMTAGSAATGGGTGTPGDPTLVTPRAMTAEVLAVNQPTKELFTVGGYSLAGYTGRSELLTVGADASEMSLVFSGCSSYWQTPVTNPMTLKVSVELDDSGDILPVTFDGDAVGLVPRASNLTSDPVSGNFYAGQRFRLRVFTPSSQVINVASQFLASEQILGDHVADTTWSNPGLEPGVTYPGMPAPIAILGKCREGVITVGAIGDSILNTPPQFERPPALWFSQPVEAAGFTGINMGQEARRYDNRDPITGVMQAVTHMLVEYGVNNILETGISVASLWALARECYAAIDAANPGVPIWQTTPTPIVLTSNACATLAGQVFDGSASTARRDARLAWNAWLRDGCPIDPTTLDALATGATGSVIRAGHADHPLRGIVDIAAAVEDGGTSSPSGKWRVDLGPVGGDGVHPSPLGEQTMKAPVTAWLATLT